LAVGRGGKGAKEEKKGSIDEKLTSLGRIGNQRREIGKEKEAGGVSRGHLGRSRGNQTSSISRLSALNLSLKERDQGPKPKKVFWGEFKRGNTSG